MGATFWEMNRWRRLLVMAGLYTAVLTLSLYFAYELRFDFVVPLEFQQDEVDPIGWTGGADF